MAVALAVAAAASGGAAAAPACDKPFPRAAWRDAASIEAPAGGLTERQRIADQLLRCHTLRHATRRRVRHLLGPREAGSSQTWTYVTGLERGKIQVDSELLDVRFDKRGRVRRLTLSNG